MVLWSALFAAILCWVVADFEPWGFLLGGIAGAIYGWGARRAVLGEVAKATAGLRRELDILAARLGGRPDAPMPTRPAAGDRVQEFVGTSPMQSSVNPAPAAVPVQATTVRPAPAPARSEPGFVETAVAGAVSAAKNWLLGGNTIVRVGLIILFVGLSFLASYAASAGLFPIELRLVLVLAAGIALLVTGFRTRAGRPAFGLTLQGGGVAVIYLTLFAAARLYDTVPVVAAFVLMTVVCALGCVLALLQRSQALAATSFAGGFAVPLLLSSGHGSAAGLFTYYTILNLAILFIAHRQSWRVLNLIGFFATFGVMTLWEVVSYRPADFAIAECFLVASVLIYVATAVLYTRATPGRLGNVVDTTLLFGPALAGFGLEVGLIHDRPFGSAFAALAFAALYIGVALFTTRNRQNNLRVMNETMLAIGIGFVTLAVPLALGARWTSSAWALEGAGAFWVGMRQARWMPRVFGLALQLVAALVYLGSLGPNVAALPFANAGFVGAVLIALATLATAWWLRGSLPHSGSRLAEGYARAEAVLGAPAFLFGFAFWWIAWVVEATRMLPPVELDRVPARPVFDQSTQALLMMLAFVVSAWGAQAIGRRLRWRVASWPSLATLPVLVAGLLGELASASHVLCLPDLPVWLAAIALHLRTLYLNDAATTDNPDVPARTLLLRATHVGQVWLATALLADCLALGIDRGRLWQASWAEASVLLGFVAILVGLTAWAGRALYAPALRTRWPLRVHAGDYAWIAAAPLAALLLFAALLTALFTDGSAAPLPFLPILNPVDLMLALSLATLELWRRTVGSAAPPPAGAAILRAPAARAILAAFAFVAVNTAWLRIAHHLLGVAWTPEALLASFVVQTGLAILWSLLAVALMVVASRRATRALWLVGAGLLGLTVVKLLLVDLNNAGGAARIVAFIVVGVLMLVVGYLAPLPPRAAPPAAEDGKEPATT